MGLSQDLISQFVKVTNDSKETKKDSVLYGEVKYYQGEPYVKLDGSDMLTPYETTTEVKEGDRVSVTVKNHTLTATGNLTSPSARSEEVTTISNTVESIKVNYAKIDWSNINFANVNIGKFQELYATSGILKDIVVEDQKITGQLVGVTIIGDSIVGGTVVADKLVIKGSNGLYYKLNTDGMKTEAEQTDYNSLNGSVITANSITASKISVDDLVAFDATIGGFNISESSLYSGLKESVDSPISGVYLDDDGQVAIGNDRNFIKFYVDENGDHKLAIQTENIKSTNENLYSGTRMFNGSKWNNMWDWEQMEFNDELGFREYGRWGAWNGLSQEVYVEEGETYTFSLYAKGDANANVAIFTDWDDTATTPAHTDIGALTEEYVRYSATFVANSSGYIHPRLENRSEESWVQIYGIKFEHGDTATEWCPSKEDGGTDIYTSSTSATNYLSYSDDGLIVGDMTAESLEGNVRIRPEGVDIRKGDDTLATFSTSTFETVDEFGNTVELTRTNITSIQNTELGTHKNFGTELYGFSLLTNQVEEDESDDEKAYSSKSEIISFINNPSSGSSPMAYVNTKAVSGPDGDSSSVEIRGDKVSVEDGNGNVYDLLKLCNKFKVVTGTISATGWNYFSYPIGFTPDNCTVLNLEVNYDGTVWRSGVGINATGDPTRLFVSHMLSERIGVYTDSTASGIIGQSIRIVLMRID